MKTITKQKPKTKPKRTITKKQPKKYENVNKLYQKETDKIIEQVLPTIATFDKAFGTFTNFLEWLPNPDEVLKKANIDIKVYREALSDPFVKGLFLSRRAGVLSKEWKIESNNTDENKTKFITETFENLNIYRILENFLDAVYYGYAVFEYSWLKSNINLILIDVVLKPQEWFNYTDNAELLFRTENEPNGIKVPDNKFLSVKSEDTYQNPYGIGIGSLIYWSHIFKKGGLKFWVKFTEKYGMPWVEGKYQENATSTKEVEKFIEDVEAMVQDAIIVTPESYNISMTTPQTQSSDIYKALLSYLSTEISIAFLGHGGIAQETPGKLGNETAAIEIRGQIIASDKRLIENSMNEIIQTIYKLNYGSSQFYPKFVLFEEDEVDKLQAERDQILVNTGIKFTKEYFKKTYNLDEDDFELKTETIELPPQNNDEFQIETDDQKVIDLGSDEAIEKSLPMMKKFLAPIEKFLNKQADFSDAINNIAELYPEMNSAQIQKDLSDRLFLADVIGRLSVQNETNTLG